MMERFVAGEAQVARLLNPPATSSGTRILSRWYADPLDRAQAQSLLARADVTLYESLRGGRRCITCRLGTLIAGHWLGRSVERDYDVLARLTAGTRHGRALVELIYGQLLMSGRRVGALEHLARGLAIGWRLFDPSDFFVVSKRHKLLSHLVLGSRAAPPASLKQLLTEAAVIRRLQSGAGYAPPYASDPRDTLG